MELNKLDPKREREIENVFVKYSEIVDDEALDESNYETLVEDDGGQRKGRNKDRSERLLDGETLSHACEKWKKKVDEFQKTITKAKEPTEKEPDK
ncbi:11460_t:CDS:1, partial [Dentiscutata erythropus]